MTDTYLLVDEIDTIVNSIVWDGDAANWQPPIGLRAFKFAGAWGNGWKWDGSKAYDPNPPPPPPPSAPTPKQVDGMTVV